MSFVHETSDLASHWDAVALPSHWPPCAMWSRYLDRGSPGWKQL